MKYIEANSKWQSVFIQKIDFIQNDKRKISLLKDEVVRLEKRCRKLEAAISEKTKPSKIDINNLEPTKKISHKDFYKSKKWLDLRFHILTTHKRKCVLCGSLNDLQVDHIIPRSLCPEKQYDVNNMQILCRDCNYGKSTKIMDASEL